MSYIGKNIRKIRSVKKLSQSAFAQLFNIGRASIGAYEEGRADPKIDTIILIAKHFNLTLDQLITKELTVNELIRFDIFRKDLTKNSSTSLPEARPKTGIPLLRASNFSQYLKNLEKESFLESLPHIDLPHNASGNFLAFEVISSEMEYMGQGIIPTDIVLCKVCETEKLEEDKVYVLALHEELITRRLKAKKKPLVFDADSPFTDPIEINKDQIQKVWEVKGVYSTKIKKPGFVEERLMKLEAHMSKLEKKVK